MLNDNRLHLNAAALPGQSGGFLSLVLAITLTFFVSDLDFSGARLSTCVTRSLWPKPTQLPTKQVSPPHPLSTGAWRSQFLPVPGREGTTLWLRKKVSSPLTRITIQQTSCAEMKVLNIYFTERFVPCLLQLCFEMSLLCTCAFCCSYAARSGLLMGVEAAVLE